jgi:propionate CoA-transferase
MELRRGCVVNLGVGMATGIPNVAAEEGIEDFLTLTVESGIVGGIPGSGLNFGTAYNPRAIMDQAYQFDFYDGGGLDIGFLSFAQVDRHGHVNVTKFGGRADGCGGFIDISQNAKRLVFVATLTGGAKFSVGDGRITVREEGRIKKFVPDVEQISFNADFARERGQKVMFITERAVFRLSHDDGLVLTELAPGMRLREDVLDQMEFPVTFSPDMRPMDHRIFQPGPMGLREELDHV